MPVVRYKIHPAIGVARVGDSPEYFIGPERPGCPAAPPEGRYKDKAGKVKRQAVRFRVFGYDEHDTVVRELTAAEADIRWTVHLANRKAAAPLFRPRKDSATGLRNESVSGEGRDRLVIDPGPRTVGGQDVRGGQGHRFDDGTFDGTTVYLGELHTDEAGRLLVLGGEGLAGSPTDQPLLHFADNDGWFDDTSDGPVTARVTLRETQAEVDVDPAWVIVAPPDFAPSIGNIVTLYDVVEQVAFEAGWVPAPDEVSFWQDIHPLLDRAVGQQWVHAAAFRGHRRGDQADDKPEDVERRGDFQDEALLTLLSNPANPTDPTDPAGRKAQQARERVFRHVRAPRTPDDLATQETREREVRQASARYMPPMSGDGGCRTEGVPTTWLTVTPLQYARLALWAAGKFRAEPAGRAQPAPGDAGSISAGSISAGSTPAGSTPAGSTPAGPTPAELDRAALENCAGGGFFPGIEVSNRIKDRLLYAEPFRLAHQPLLAGALTERMAVPWQADFADCEGFWWPAQRPDQVVLAEDYGAVLAARQSAGRPGPRLDTLAWPRHRWARGIGQGPAASTDSATVTETRYRDMVREWSKLGFVVGLRETAEPRPVWAETERDRYFGLRDRDYFHYMLNPDRYLDFRDTAKELAEKFIAEAHNKIEHDRELDSELDFFAYDERTFETRLGSIYRYLVDQVAMYDPATDGTFHSREDVIERILQFAPLNQTDGKWLRNIAAVEAPAEVTALLTRIRDDENGNGIPARNHSHIYTELMRSIGLDPAPVESAEYAQDPRFLDSAFTAALLQYVVSEFSQDFLPEILGMTLHFEWESVYLTVLVTMFEHHGIDPRFYQLHLAIDNVAEGHGALATRAVRRYLADFTGEEQQVRWRRIWDGYVAFREAGTLGADLRALLNPPLDAKAVAARVREMIERKKPFGNLNHGRVASTGMTNDLFDDPTHMLAVLADPENGFVVAGEPDRSRLIALFGIDGPMYEVFTAQEQQLWRDWIVSLKEPEAPAGAGVPPDTPDGGPRHYKRVHLSSTAAAFRADPRGTLRGRGAVQ